LICERALLPSSRRSRDAAVGRVGLRGRGGRLLGQFFGSQSCQFLTVAAQGPNFAAQAQQLRKLDTIQ